MTIETAVPRVTNWSCTPTDDSVEGTVEKCAYDGDITLTPFNSYGSLACDSAFHSVCVV
jgi:hypothetical protein